MNKTRKLKLVLSSLLLLGFIFTSCTNNTEPANDIQKLVYNPTQQEAKDQSEAMIKETVKQITESMAGYSKLPDSLLGKANDSRDYYYFAGWHTWRGEIDKSPFGMTDAYTAEYLAKIQFQDGSKNVQKNPDGAEYMRMYLNAHIAFGFVNGEPYGDEVWYEYDGNVTPLTANPSIINGEGTYERRWVGVMNGQDTELHYKWEIVLNDIEFRYDYIANDFSLTGNIMIYVNNYNSNDDALYTMMFRFNNSRFGLVEVYRNGQLIQTYGLEIPNFYEIYNLPSLENWEFGASFEFPTPIPL